VRVEGVGWELGRFGMPHCTEVCEVVAQERQILEFVIGIVDREGA
jgi:hypothetical protein